MASGSMMAAKPERHAVKGAVMALCLLTAMNFVNYLDRYILPAVQEQMKREFHLSDNQIGSLTLWFFVAYVLASPVTGWLGDRFPRKPMIVIATLMIAATNLLTAYGHSYASLNLRHAALGVGEASFGIFAPALLADYFADDQRNAVLTVFNVAIPVGAAMGYLFGGVVAAEHGWRMAFAVSAAPGAVIALLILFLMREPTSGDGDGTAVKARHGMDRGSIGSLLTNKAYLCSIMGYAAVTFSLGGISWWMPSFLNRVEGRSLAASGTLMGGITVVCGLGGTLAGGALAQWWSRRTAKALYLVPALSAILAVLPGMVCFFGPSRMTISALSAAVFLVFLGTGPVNAATLNAVPARLRATAMAGQLFALHVFGDAFSPKIIGMVSDRSNLRLGLGLTLVTFVLAAAIFFVGARYAPPLTHSLEGAAGEACTA